MSLWVNEQLYLSKLFTSEMTGNLTWEAVASAECICELRSHLYDLILICLQLSSPCFHCCVDHVLNALLIQGIEYIAYPLLVKVTPIIFIRQVFEQCRFGSRICLEVFDGQSIYLWDSCYLHSWSLDILLGYKETNLHPSSRSWSVWGSRCWSCPSSVGMPRTPSSRSCRHLSLTTSSPSRCGHWCAQLCSKVVVAALISLIELWFKFYQVWLYTPHCPAF